jgi:hypothetical protein
LIQAREAIELHLEGLLEDREKIPELSPIEELQGGKEYQDGTWCVVEVDLSKLAGKVKRINITVPETLLDRIDAAAAEEHTSRSGFLVSAAVERMAKDVGLWVRTGSDEARRAAWTQSTGPRASDRQSGGGV